MILNPFTAPIHTKFININNSFASNIFDKMLLINGDSWSQLSLIFLKSNDEEEEQDNSIKQSFDVNLILNLLLKLNSIKNSSSNRNYIYLEKNIDIIIKNYLKRLELSDKKNYYELKNIIKEIKNENTYKNSEHNSKNSYNENLIKIYKLYKKINNNEIKNISDNNRYNNNNIGKRIINEKNNIEEVSQLLIKNSNLIIENNIKAENNNLSNLYRISTKRKIVNSKFNIILGLKASNTSIAKRSIKNNTLFHKIFLNNDNNEVVQDINSKIILKNTDIKRENNYVQNLSIEKLQQLKINNKETVMNQLLENEKLNKYIGTISNISSFSPFSSFNLIQDFNIIKQIYEKNKKLIIISFKEDIIKNQILNKKFNDNFINNQIKFIKNNLNNKLNYLLDSRTIYKKINQIEDDFINNQISSMENINMQQYYINKTAVINKLQKLQNIIQKSYSEQNSLKQNSIIEEYEESKISLIKKSNIGLNNINKYFKMDIEKFSNTESFKNRYSKNMNYSTDIINKIVSKKFQIHKFAHMNLYKYEGAKMILKNFNITKESDLKQPLLNVIYDNKKFIVKNIIKKDLIQEIISYSYLRKNNNLYEDKILSKKETNHLFNLININKKNIIDSYSQYLNINETSSNQNYNTIKAQEDKSIKTYNLSVEISNNILNLIKRNSITNNNILNNLEKYKRTALNNKNIKNYKLNFNKKLFDYKVNSFLSKNEKNREQYYYHINKSVLNFNKKENLIYILDAINKQFNISFNSVKNNAINSIKQNVIEKNRYHKDFLLNLNNYKNDIVFNNNIENTSHAIFNKKIKLKLNLIQNSVAKDYLLLKNFAEILYTNKILREDNKNVFYDSELAEINNIFNMKKQSSINMNSYLQKYKLRQASKFNLVSTRGNAYINKNLSTLVDMNEFIKRYNKTYISVLNNINKEHKKVMLLPEYNDLNNSNSKYYLMNQNKYQNINLKSEVKEVNDVNFKYRKNTIVNEQEKNIEDINTKNDIITEQQISKIINETVEKIVEKKLSENRDSNISEEEKINNLSKKVIANIERNLNYEKRRRGLI